MDSLRRRLIEVDVAIKAELQTIEEHKGSEKELTALCKSCKEKIKKSENLIEEMQTFAKELSKDQQATMFGEIKQHLAQHQFNLFNLREATLRALKSNEQNKRSELMDLNAGQNVGSNVRQRTNFSAVKQTTEVTDSMSSLIQQINVQVKQSEENLGVLLSGSDTLAKTEDEFRNMGATIQVSGRLLSKYASRECTDKMLLGLCVVMFYAACCYVIRKRLFGY